MNTKLYEKLHEEETIQRLQESIIDDCIHMVERQGAFQNEDGSWSSDSDIDISSKGYEKFPIKFKEVKGDFICHDNQLTTLENSPEYVGGNFDCHNNRLTTLEGAPEEVKGFFNVENSKLPTLKGSPKKVGGDYLCQHNQLNTVEGVSEEIGGDFDCSDNQLRTLSGLQKVKGRIRCTGNPETASKLLKTVEK
jgi:hypothetical protein